MRKPFVCATIKKVNGVFLQDVPCEVGVYFHEVRDRRHFQCSILRFQPPLLFKSAREIAKIGDDRKPDVYILGNYYKRKFQVMLGTGKKICQVEDRSPYTIKIGEGVNLVLMVVCTFAIEELICNEYDQY